MYSPSMSAFARIVTNSMGFISLLFPFESTMKSRKGLEPRKYVFLSHSLAIPRLLFARPAAPQIGHLRLCQRSLIDRSIYVSFLLLIYPNTADFKCLSTGTYSTFVYSSHFSRIIARLPHTAFKIASYHQYHETSFSQ